VLETSNPPGATTIRARRKVAGQMCLECGPCLNSDHNVCSPAISPAFSMGDLKLSLESQPIPARVTDYLSEWTAVCP